MLKVVFNGFSGIVFHCLLIGYDDFSKQNGGRGVVIGANLSQQSLYGFH